MQRIETATESPKQGFRRFRHPTPTVLFALASLYHPPQLFINMVTEYAPVHTEIVPSSLADQLLTALREGLGEIRYNLWFGQDVQCRIAAEEEDRKKAVILVRNDFEVSAIRRNCINDINQAILKVCGESLPFEVKVNDVKSNAGELKPSTRIVKPSIPKPVRVLLPGMNIEEQRKDPRRANRKFASMDTFVAGQSNDLACGGANFAILQPGQINPIYLFGPTSVGKTHLLEGIWTTVSRQKSGQHAKLQPLFMTAQQFIAAFTERFQNGMTRDNTQTFRSRFKGISHLLIDDIQAFVKAEQTQNELVQVIDMLKSQGVQIVLTGDRPAKELRLRKELIARIESGLACQIELPERELSLKICTQMIKDRKLPVEPEVCRLIASRFGTHGRQITGAVNRLYLAYQAGGKTITAAEAEEILSDLLRMNRKDIRLQDISKAVCDEFGIMEESLRSKTRIKQISSVRMLAMWLARKYTRSALSEIGLYFGNHTHSSVIAAAKKMDRQVLEDPKMANALKKIEHVLE